MLTGLVARGEGEGDGFLGKLAEGVSSYRARRQKDGKILLEPFVEIPAELREEAETYREMLIETVAESDDSLLEKYLHGGKVEAQEIKDALRRATIAGDAGRWRGYGSGV